jgi:hypothetical protein
MGQDLAGPQTQARPAATAALSKGVVRALTAFGFSSLTELVLPNGQRADVVGVGPEGALLIVEIKSGLADFRADSKWPGYLDFCDRFYFALPSDTPQHFVPLETGLIVADVYSAQIVRDSPTRKLAPATRRAMLIRFARAAADRLQRI